MRVVVSPYHLTSREPAAMAALLLAREVVTVLPTSLTGDTDNDAQLTARGVPSYVEFMSSWAWSMPLWEDGVVSSQFAGDDAAADIHTACARLDEEDALADLRALVHVRRFGEATAELDAIARDVLKAGPDPAVSLPVAAAMDTFAARYDLAAVRAHPQSVAQKAEARLASPVCAVAVPVFIQASGERLVEARITLDDALEPLRDALDAAMSAAQSTDGVGPIPERTEADVRAAADRYAEAWALERAELMRPEEDEDEPRIREATVMLSAALLPTDAVLRSSLVAARRYTRPTGTATLDAATDTPRCRTLVVKPLGREHRR